MKKANLSILILIILLTVPRLSSAQEAEKGVAPPVKLHGKALKAKQASIQVLEGTPNQAYQKIAPIWASKSNMEKTLKSIRKQAAKVGADAVIDVRVKTQKLESTYSDPGFWGGPYWGGGFGGPWGGYWGGMGYWGGYVQSHTYTQPVVSGWAVKWTGPAPAEPKDTIPPKTLQEKVEDAPSG